MSIRTAMVSIVLLLASQQAYAQSAAQHSAAGADSGDASNHPGDASTDWNDDGSQTDQAGAPQTSQDTLSKQQYERLQHDLRQQRQLAKVASDAAAREQADSDAQNQKAQTVNISHFAKGMGWCKLADPTTHKIYYTSVFAGNPDEDSVPRALAFKTFILKSAHSAAGEQLNEGNINCVWSRWDQDYVLRDQQRQDEFMSILHNFTIDETGWRP